jgi:tRNA(Ile)-lysidine synthase
LPRDVVWRFRKEGDIIEKFGGGTKKLKSYLIDKKIPLRERDFLPVLASGNEIFAIAGLEISDKVKIDSEVKSLIKIEVIKKN